MSLLGFELQIVQFVAEAVYRLRSSSTFPNTTQYPVVYKSSKICSHSDANEDKSTRRHIPEALSRRN
jgi:hypothetical protein